MWGPLSFITAGPGIAGMEAIKILLNLSFLNQCYTYEIHIS